MEVNFSSSFHEEPLIGETKNYSCSADVACYQELSLNFIVFTSVKGIYFVSMKNLNSS